MKKTFFARHGLLILMLVFFCVPFVMRGARQSVQSMKNDIKDWLPSEYDETGELNWFRDHFLGEQFVVVSWDGCHGDEEDEKFSLFLRKLLPALTPTEIRERLLAEGQTGEITAEAIASVDPLGGLLEEVLKRPEVDVTRARHVGDDLGLYLETSVNHNTITILDYYNWGGQQEKWLRGAGHQWYYILPDGKLFRFTGQDAPVAAAGRWVWRKLVGEQLFGELVKDLGPTDGPWYYENPRRLRGQLFKTITAGPGVYESLVNADKGVLRNDEAEASRRLNGTLFGPDGKQTCLIFTLTENGKRDLHQSIGRGWMGKPLGRLYEAGMESNIPMEQMRFGGPPVDNVAVDEEGTVTLVRLIGFSVVLGVGLSYICFRNVMITLMVFFVGGISAFVSMALVSWLGSSVDAIVLSMPSLVYVLGLSGAVHFVNYYHQAVDEKGLDGACESAVSHAWKPAILCNITTAIGLFCLLTSEIVPIRKFGLFSGIAVLAMVAISLIYLPAALQIFPQPPRKKRELVDGEEVPFLAKYLDGFWNIMGRFIIKHHTAVAIACTVFIIAIGWGVQHVKTSVNMLKMFDPSAKIINDYTWLEKNIGRLVPMEVVMKVEKNSLLTVAEEKAPLPNDLDAAKKQVIDDLAKLNFLNRMELAARVQKTVETAMGEEGEDVVGHAMSAATFAPEMPPAANDLGTFIERRATNKKLEEHREEFLASDYLRLDKKDEAELWRISVRLAATKGVDYGGFVKDLRNLVGPVMNAYKQREAVIRAVANHRFEEKSKAGAIAIDEVIKVTSPAGARVLVLGLPSLVDNDPKQFVAEIDSPRIEASNLVELLSIARLKVESPKTDVSYTAEQLAKYECFVIGGKISQELDSLIRASGKPVVRTDALAADAAPTTAVSAVYTGVVPIVYKAQRALLESLIQSTMWSFLTITPLMMIVARSFSAGTVAMLPNILPVFAVFGYMGWMGIEVDVGSMMTASIALGVAVDDTIHYLTWFREELNKCGDRKIAILNTYKRCATPTFQAALISGLGLSIFALSTFTPTQRFGYLMLSILWAGVAAELIYFPALLAGPLGWVFKPEKGSAHAPSPAALEEEVEERDMPTVVRLPLVKPHQVRHDHSHKRAQ